MADNYIQLNKPLFENKGPRPQQTRPEPTPREVPTFGGFWLRFLALVFDLLIVVMIHNALVAAGMSDRFFELGPWMTVLGALALLLVYVFVPLRVFPGQTLGKKLLRLRVVSLDDQMQPCNPPLAAYLKRFIIIFAVFVIQWALMEPPMTRKVIMDQPMAIALIIGFVLSIYLTQISMFLTGSWKRGIHDLWAGTFVIRIDSTGPGLAEAITNPASDSVLNRNARAKRLPMMMIPALTILFTGVFIYQSRSDTFKLQTALSDQLSEVTGGETSFRADALPKSDPKFWVLQISTNNSLGLPWDEVADSEEYRNLMSQTIDLLESEFDPVTFGQPGLNDVPYIGALGVVMESYTFIPGILTTAPLAWGQRGEAWNHQVRPLPLYIQEGEELDPTRCLLPGSPLAGSIPSPELIAMALADLEAVEVSAEMVGTPISGEMTATLVSP